MYLISNKDWEDMITLLSVLEDREKHMPLESKSIKELNYTRRSRLLIKKMKRQKKLKK